MRGKWGANDPMGPMARERKKKRKKRRRRKEEGNEKKRETSDVWMLSYERIRGDVVDRGTR